MQAVSSYASGITSIEKSLALAMDYFPIVKRHHTFDEMTPHFKMTSQNETNLTSASDTFQS